jgi:hypothetical protein
MWLLWETEEVRIMFWWGIPEEKRPPGRPRRRWEENMKMDLQEMGWGDMDWIHLALDRDIWRAIVNAVMNLGFHKVGLIS